MKPTIGRVVLALVDPATNNGSDVAPAIITRVFSDTIVNVRVLLDGPDVPWKTSISLHDDRDAVDAAKAQREAELADRGGPHAPIVMHAAYWPPRVGA